MKIWRRCFVSSFLICLLLNGPLCMIKVSFDLVFAYQPSFKCGASTRLGYAQLDMQKEENQVNRDWQTVEAEKARQYNTGERVASQDWQKQMLDYQNEYNTPLAQVQRFQQAGLNPSLMMQGSGQTVSANPSPSSPAQSPMPSGVGGLNPVSMQPFELQIPSILNGVGSFMKNIGEAAKLGVDTSFARKSFDLNIRKLSADASVQEFTAAGIKLQNEINQATKSPVIKRAFEEYNKVAWDAILSHKQGLSEGQRLAVLKAQERLNDALSNYHGQNADLIKLDVEHYNEAFNMRMKIGKSEVAENYAVAANQSASADQTRIFNKIYSDKRYQHSLVTQAVEAGRQAVSQSAISKSQAEQMTYLVEQAAYSNDMKEFTYWSNQVNQFVNTLGQTASQFYGAGALRELIKLRQIQGRPSLMSGNDYYMEGGLLFRR